MRAVSPDIVWAGAAGAVMFVGTLAAPFVHRWRMRRHALRLEARQHRGYDRYYEELRDLEAWPPQGRAAFDAKTILGALCAGGFLALVVYTWRRPDAEYLMQMLVLAVAAFGLVAAAWKGFCIWRDAQPDPRRQIMSPAPGDATARERRIELWRQVGSTAALAAGSFMMALLSADKALKLLP